MTRKRIVVAAVLSLLVLGVTVLHLNYPLPYIYTILVYQGPDYSDIFTFPSRKIEASNTPRMLPRLAGDHVELIIEQHLDIEDFDVFLEQTETTSFLVVHEGTLIEERYLQGNDRESMQNTFSVSKSITSAIVGVALNDGALRLKDSITTLLPELAERDPHFSEITLEHLINMRSGIRFSDDLAFPLINSDSALTYYHPDLLSVVLEKTMIEKAPGDFLYNNYNPSLTGLMLRRSTGITPLEILGKEVWQPMGATLSAGWSVDNEGVERMESGFFASAHDLALFGLLYLGHGELHGEQILAETWVLDSTAYTERLELEEYNGRSWSYHGGWWIVPRAEGPPDFTAIGHFGQFIYVSPQYDAVFVRTAQAGAIGEIATGLSCFSPWRKASNECLFSILHKWSGNRLPHHPERRS